MFATPSSENVNQCGSCVIHMINIFIADQKLLSLSFPDYVANLHRLNNKVYLVHILEGPTTAVEGTTQYSSIDLTRSTD